MSLALPTIGNGAARLHEKSGFRSNPSPDAYTVPRIPAAPVMTERGDKA